MQTAAALRQEPFPPTLNTNDDPSVGGSEGSKNVAAAATPETIVAVSTPCRRVIITARAGNTKPIAYGFSNAVRATAGAEVGAQLAAGASVSLPVADALLVWIDAQVNGEGVSFTIVK